MVEAAPDDPRRKYAQDSLSSGTESRLFCKRRSSFQRLQNLRIEWTSLASAHESPLKMAIDVAGWLEAEDSKDTTIPFLETKMTCAWERKKSDPRDMIRRRAPFPSRCQPSGSMYSPGKRWAYKVFIDVAECRTGEVCPMVVSDAAARSQDISILVRYSVLGEIQHLDKAQALFRAIKPQADAVVR